MCWSPAGEPVVLLTDRGSLCAWRPWRSASRPPRTIAAGARRRSPSADREPLWTDLCIGTSHRSAPGATIVWRHRDAGSEEQFGPAQPIVIAFGELTHVLAREHIRRGTYSRLVGVMHYTAHVGPERYRALVRAELRL